MLDINFSNFHIPTWMIYTAAIGFFFCVFFSIASLIFIASKEYTKSTIIISTLITGFILISYYLSNIYPNNFALQFIPTFTLSFDMIIFITLSDYLSIFGFYIIAVIVKFFLVFGFVGVMQKLLNRYFFY
jgi:hypothetical protein